MTTSGWEKEEARESPGKDSRAPGYMALSSGAVSPQVLILVFLKTTYIGSKYTLVYIGFITCKMMCFCLVNVFVCGALSGTQGFMHAKYVLYR